MVTFAPDTIAINEEDGEMQVDTAGIGSENSQVAAIFKNSNCSVQIKLWGNFKRTGNVVK